MSSIERITIKLPDGFDAAKHQRALLAKIAKDHGEGFEIDSIDPTARTATVSRQVAITEVSAGSSSASFDVRLARGTKPVDGERVSIKLADQYPGYEMTAFEPFLGKATLTRLSDNETRCRGAVAVALSVKPWEVQVKQAPDGGYDLTLPRTYVGSKHDAKLAEVATTVVGRDGWYVNVDAQRLTARIIPSDPPSFPEAFPTPLERLGAGDLDKTPFGHVLPEPGVEVGPEIAIDWRAAAFALVAGTPGSGKSVLLNAVIADALSNGSELVVVDDMSKAVDFEWCKDFCRPGGWGCDSLGEAVAALGLVREEGARRAKRLKDLGINNWLDMPAGERFTPILVVVDEVSALLVPDPAMKGIPKDHPLAIEITERNLARAMLASFITKILAELRFVGVRMVLSTQATNANTGVGPSMRTKIGHSILQGNNPSKSARAQIFADESSVPTVPDSVKASGLRSRGVGVCTLEGQAPAVYKSYFASTTDYRTRLLALKVPTTAAPEPTAGQVDRFLPTLDDERDSGGRGGRGGSDPRGERAPSGKPAAQVAAEMGDRVGVALHDGSLGTGYEKANAIRHLAANPGKATGKEKRDAAEEAAWAAQSGEVTVRPAPAGPAGDGW